MENSTEILLFNTLKLQNRSIFIVFTYTQLNWNQAISMIKITHSNLKYYIILLIKLNHRWMGVWETQYFPRKYVFRRKLENFGFLTMIFLFFLCIDHNNTDRQWQMLFSTVLGLSQNQNYQWADSNEVIWVWNPIR